MNLRPRPDAAAAGNFRAGHPANPDEPTDTGEPATSDDPLRGEDATAADPPPQQDDAAALSSGGRLASNAAALVASRLGIALAGCTLVAGLVVVLSTPSHAYDVAFQVKDRLVPLAVAAMAGRLAQLAFTIAIVLRGGSLLWFVIPAVLNDLLVLLWKLPAAHRMMDFRYRVDVGVWKELLKEAVPLATGTAFVTLYYRVDSVMLSSSTPSSRSDSTVWPTSSSTWSISCPLRWPSPCSLPWPPPGPRPRSVFTP